VNGATETEWQRQQRDSFLFKSIPEQASRLQSREFCEDWRKQNCGKIKPQRTAEECLIIKASFSTIFRDLFTTLRSEPTEDQKKEGQQAAAAAAAAEEEEKEGSSPS
jgi:hypothetical protein